MKKLLTAVALGAAVTAASAGFTVTNPSAVLNVAGNDFAGTVGTSGIFGTVETTVTGTTTFEFLGSESGFGDLFTVDGVDFTEAPFSTSLGQSAGVLPFLFTGLAPATATNGVAYAPGDNPSFLIFGYSGAGDTEIFIGYNDSFIGDADFDDYIVKMTFVPGIPEPSTYALMLAGLGVVGFVASRRRKV